MDEQRARELKQKFQAELNSMPPVELHNGWKIIGISDERPNGVNASIWPDDDPECAMVWMRVTREGRKSPACIHGTVVIGSGNEMKEGIEKCIHISATQEPPEERDFPSESAPEVAS